MNFKFVLSIVCIGFDMQATIGVNQARVGRSIPGIEGLQKLTGVAVSQGPISPKCHSPGGLLLLYFSTGLSGTFGISVSVDFAHTDRGRFLIWASRGGLSPKSKKSPAFFGFWAQNFFGGLNRESATIGVCRVHVCIGSGGFGRIR